MTYKAAFSLIELAIVLVILGLLVGGIMTGQSLIRAAELRSVTRELQGYQAAVTTFRDKYLAIPGDMRNATAFWGFRGTTAAPGCVSNSGITAVTTSGTCDGNGDSALNGGTGVASSNAEIFQFFNQLALAGLIEGTYPGIWSTNATVQVGTNVPVSKISNGGWWVAFDATGLGSDTAYATIDYGNFMEIMSRQNGPVLKPEEAWNIDTKIDDGKPAYGTVIARGWNNTCAAADDGTHAKNDLVASYKLTDSSLQCSLIYRKAF